MLIIVGARTKTLFIFLRVLVRLLPKITLSVENGCTVLYTIFLIRKLVRGLLSRGRPADPPGELQKPDKLGRGGGGLQVFGRPEMKKLRNQSFPLFPSNGISACFFFLQMIQFLCTQAYI